MTSTMETQGVELDTQDETEGTEPNRNRKNPLNRLKDRVKQLDALSRNKGLKATKQADVALEAASIERLLYNDSRDDKNNETLALNAQLTAQHEQDTAEIARVTQALAQANAQARTPERIPESTSALQEQVSTLETLLASVVTLAKSVDTESRTRHAVSLVIKYGKRAMETVTNLGVDYSSVSMALKEKDTELLSRLEQAKQEGTSTPIYRAVLLVRDGVTATIGKQQPRFVNEFSDEYDSL
jgi:hypothetical protein